MNEKIDVSTHGEGPGNRFIDIEVAVPSYVDFDPARGVKVFVCFVCGDRTSYPWEFTGTFRCQGRCTYAETASQPPPSPNSHPAIQDLVTADIAIRKAQGIAKYGTALQPWNGRDALVDGYQEALDLVQYLRQAIYERDGR
jgi:hypothetical protein